MREGHWFQSSFILEGTHQQLALQCSGNPSTRLRGYSNDEVMRCDFLSGSDGACVSALAQKSPERDGVRLAEAVDFFMSDRTTNFILERNSFLTESHFCNMWIVHHSFLLVHGPQEHNMLVLEEFFVTHDNFHHCKASIIPHPVLKYHVELEYKLSLSGSDVMTTTLKKTSSSEKPALRANFGISFMNSIRFCINFKPPLVLCKSFFNK